MARDETESHDREQNYHKHLRTVKTAFHEIDLNWTNYECLMSRSILNDMLITIHRSVKKRSAFEVNSSCRIIRY